MVSMSPRQSGETVDLFSFGVRLGIVLIAQTSILSVAAIVALFLYVLVSLRVPVVFPTTHSSRAS
jgi:hypothetical protein